MFPADYDVPDDLLVEWENRFDQLRELLQEFREEIAEQESKCAGPAGPWCGYLTRAETACLVVALAFEELKRHRLCPEPIVAATAH